MKLPVKRLPLPAARMIAHTRPWLLGFSAGAGDSCSVESVLIALRPLRSEELLAAWDGAVAEYVEEPQERPERQKNRERGEHEPAHAADADADARGVEERGDHRVREERGEPADHDREECYARAPHAPRRPHSRRRDVAILDLRRAGVRAVPAVDHFLV